MNIILRSLTCLLILKLISCSDASNFGDNVRSEGDSKAYLDQDSADVPTAVAGGIYLFSCEHGSVDSLTSECSVLGRDNKKKVQLSNHFLESQVSVDTPEGVSSRVVKNTADAASHWTIELSNEFSSSTRSQIMAKTRIYFSATKVNNDKISAFTTSSLSNSLADGGETYENIEINASKKGLNAAELDGAYYFKAKDNVEDDLRGKSCTSICDMMGMVPDNAAGIKISDNATECKKVFQALDDTVDLMYPNKNFGKQRVNDAISWTKITRPNVKKLGCSKTKWEYSFGDPNLYYTVLGNYDPNQDVPKGIVGIRACSCKQP